MPGKGQFKASATKDSIRQREYNSKASSKKDRASRNAARSTMEKAGKVKKGDGKDVDHKNHNPRTNSKSNLRVQSASANRARNQWAKKGK